MDGATLTEKETPQATVVVNDDQAAQEIREGLLPEEEDDEEPKVRKCLGHNCNEMLPKGVYFCKKCKCYKNSVRLSGVEYNSSIQGGRGRKLNSSPTVCEHSSDART